jgi:hypothetical protein
MKKEGIQTRKRKPKSGSSISQSIDEMSSMQSSTNTSSMNSANMSGKSSKYSKSGSKKAKQSSSTSTSNALNHLQNQTIQLSNNIPYLQHHSTSSQLIQSQHGDSSITNNPNNRHLNSTE